MINNIAGNYANQNEYYFTRKTDNYNYFTNNW